MYVYIYIYTARELKQQMSWSWLPWTFEDRLLDSLRNLQHITKIGKIEEPLMATTGLWCGSRPST